MDDTKKTDLDYIKTCTNYVKACKAGDLEKVKYYLFSPDLKFNADPKNQSGFVNACQSGHLNVIKYLLESFDIEDKISIHVAYDEPFLMAAYHSQDEVLDYFLYDLKIDIFPDLLRQCKKEFPEPYYELILEKIEKRDFYLKMEDGLPLKAKSNSRKI